MSLVERFKQLDEPRLVEVDDSKQVIVVGDTHGDLNASQQVIERFLNDSSTLVFLGDYVDRGENSRENIDFLLEQKLKHPDQIYLLQGNHEGYPHLKFTPVDFWNSLDRGEFKFYAEIFEQLPLVATFKNVIALHGALPDLKSLEQVNQIESGDKDWRKITWGDFSQSASKGLGLRPTYGPDYFKRKMDDFDKNFLIRSHQPDCPQVMFNERCYTIFTSSAYADQRTVAVISAEEEITKDKIIIEEI